jgi:hypothetical protein
MKQLIVAMHSYKAPPEATVINTTSRSSGWSRGLSPFFLGPVRLYGDYVSQNVENAWQYSKCYVENTDENNEPNQSYFDWAQKGWGKRVADRYPKGRGAKPLYSLWDGQKLGYVEARKKIYLPIYSEAVRNTDAFSKLKEAFDSSDVLVLQDFDAHNINVIGYDILKLIENENIKFGHGYVLAMMLLGLL